MNHSDRDSLEGTLCPPVMDPPPLVKSDVDPFEGLAHFGESDGAVDRAASDPGTDANHDASTLDFLNPFFPEKSAAPDHNGFHMRQRSMSDNRRAVQPMLAPSNTPKKQQAQSMRRPAGAGHGDRRHSQSHGGTRTRRGRFDVEDIPQGTKSNSMDVTRQDPSEENPIGFISSPPQSPNSNGELRKLTEHVHEQKAGPDRESVPEAWAAAPAKDASKPPNNSDRASRRGRFHVQEVTQDNPRRREESSSRSQVPAHNTFKPVSTQSHSDNEITVNTESAPSSRFQVQEVEVKRTRPSDAVLPHSLPTTPIHQRVSSSSPQAANGKPVRVKNVAPTRRSGSGRDAVAAAEVPPNANAMPATLPAAAPAVPSGRNSPFGMAAELDAFTLLEALSRKIRDLTSENERLTELTTRLRSESARMWKENTELKRTVKALGGTIPGKTDDAEKQEPIKAATLKKSRKRQSSRVPSAVSVPRPSTTANTATPAPRASSGTQPAVPPKPAISES